MLIYYIILTILSILCSFFFFFNDTATTEIYTLSLHDALPIFQCMIAGGTLTKPCPLAVRHIRVRALEKCDAVDHDRRPGRYVQGPLRNRGRLIGGKNPPTSASLRVLAHLRRDRIWIPI